MIEPIQIVVFKCTVGWYFWLKQKIEPIQIVVFK